MPPKHLAPFAQAPPPPRTIAAPPLTAAAWILRLGVAGTFLGHGLYAFSVRPSWIVYLTTVGFSPEAAAIVMPAIGVVDMLVALLAIVKPIRAVFLWAALWAFAAAAIRPISGEPMLEFVERAALWCAPLAYLVLVGLPRRVTDLWKTSREAGAV